VQSAAQIFNNSSCSLAAAAAGRDKSVSAAASKQLFEGKDSDSAAGSTVGVTESDSAAIGIPLVDIYLAAGNVFHLSDAGNVLSGKRFVTFKNIYIIDL